MRRTIRVVALLLASTVAHAQEARKAPALALKDIRGRSVRLGDYKGKVVLLNFWATWCPPCRAEIPDLMKAQHQYAGRGLQVIGVTYPPEKLRDVRRFVRRLGVNYPIALGTKGTKALFDKGDTLPLTVVIDRDGNVRDVIEGILLPEEFEQKVKPLL
ncbi:MAG TPA: TlpA disulfide reductase family protein [Pyrinomonadaceae bacterium]|jgi:thiol-disulfide isomerase/thioredoxin|nr:TlpA disulfide reductase family protein [Pyrinomonadaceae bacterium]